MFVDRVRIKVSGGDGGNGCCSFRREAFVPMGGPNGGDGGDGGDVVLVAAERVGTLLDLRYRPHWSGRRGEHGRGKDQHGKSGAETRIEVPLGTVVHNRETGEILADLVDPDARFVAARGGKGGRGNARFAGASNRAPRFAEKGAPGEEREYLIELKLIADVGFVGLPNAGKSTLLAAVSAARPRIADYPFTTLSPNLGVAKLGVDRALILADIPGIIEGAADGKGLGHDFLRHIERTRVLLFLVDLSGEAPLHDLAMLDRELAQYSAAFRDRPRRYAFNKADLPENRNRFHALLNVLPQPAHLISGATGEGVQDLIEALWQDVAAARESEMAHDMTPGPPEREYTFTPPFEVAFRNGVFVVTGEKVLQTVQMTDFDNAEAVAHLQRRLEKMGVFKAIKRLGAQPGQSVVIGGHEMEYLP